MNIAELELKRNKLFTDAEAILMSAEKTPEQRTNAKQMIADATAIEGDIESLRAIEKTNAAFTRSARPVDASGGVDVVKTPEQRKKEFNGAFRQFARHGYG